jgi:hypothetical protein
MTGAMGMDDIWIPLLAMSFLLLTYLRSKRTNQKVFLTPVEQCVLAM